MTFADYDADQVEPVRKMVSFELVEDPRALSDALAQSIRELYARAEGAGLRVLGWQATFGQDDLSRFGEGIMTVSATKTARKRTIRTAAQMDAEIMHLLSIRHVEDYTN